MVKNQQKSHNLWNPSKPTTSLPIPIENHH